MSEISVNKIDTANLNNEKIFNIFEAWLKSERELSTNQIAELVKNSDLSDVEQKLGILYFNNTENSIDSNRYDTLVYSINQQKKIISKEKILIGGMLALSLIFVGSLMFAAYQSSNSLSQKQLPPTCDPIQK